MSVEDKFKKFEGRYLDKRLTDFFKKDKDTLLRAILEAAKEEFIELQKATVEVEELVDFDNNYGNNLDLLGSNYNELRHGESDERFLDRIKALMYAFGSHGDEDTIISGLAKYLATDEKNIRIHQIDIRKIKISFATVLSIKKINSFIKRVKAAGIRYELEIFLEAENNINFFASTYEHIDNIIIEDWREINVLQEYDIDGER